jgi:hypothetical protein
VLSTQERRKQADLHEKSLESPKIAEKRANNPNLAEKSNFT